MRSKKLVFLQFVGHGCQIEPLPIAQHFRATDRTKIDFISFAERFDQLLLMNIPPRSIAARLKNRRQFSIGISASKRLERLLQSGRMMPKIFDHKQFFARKKSFLSTFDTAKIGERR